MLSTVAPIDVLTTTPGLLAWLDAPSLARLAATSRALHQAASDDALWGTHLLRAFPASEPLLRTLQSRGGQGYVKALYALRMREQQARWAAPDRRHPTPEEEAEARLRRELADVYLELQVTHQLTGQLMASRLLSLATDEEVVFAFFRGETVPLTMHMAEQPEGWEEDMSITRSATLLRLGAQAKVLVLAGRDEFNHVEIGWKDDGIRGVTIWFEGDTCPVVPEYAQLWEFGHHMEVIVHETTDKDRGIWKMGMQVDIWCDLGGSFGWEMDSNLASARGVLEYIDYLFKGKVPSLRLPRRLPKSDD